MASKTELTGRFYQFYPPDMRPRTQRSEQAQAVGIKVLGRIKQLEDEADEQLAKLAGSKDFAGRKVVNELWMEAFALERILPVVFGIPSPRGHDYYFSNVLSTHPNQNQPFPLAELDPEHNDGLIAAVHLGQDNKFLRNVLGVKINGDAYSENEEGVFYQTCLTASDGIAWFEPINEQLGPAIVVYPVTQVNS